MRIRKNISFCASKISDLLYDFSIFFKKQSSYIDPFTSINDLDKQISILLPDLLNSKTFYIEVGANDGITQSNTFFLEKKYKAKGMLIEASPSLYEKCFIYRSKRNIIENYALVSPNYKKKFVKLIFGNLFTTQIKSKKVFEKDHDTIKIIKEFESLIFCIETLINSTKFGGKSGSRYVHKLFNWQKITNLLIENLSSTKN